MPKPEWLVLDRAQIPDDDGEIDLIRKGRELVIRVNGRELMGNLAHGSEDALAELSIHRLGEHPAPRVLVGGLGMGFTLQATLQLVNEAAEVTVAELIPSIVEWNRGLLADVAGRPLFDPRTRVHVGDVCELMESRVSAWDVILLDVDNGPRGLTRDTNGWLYSKEGLEAAHRALRPGGVLGVWSATNNRQFARRMESIGFDVETSEIYAREDSRHIHVVWTGVRLGDGYG